MQTRDSESNKEYFERKIKYNYETIKYFNFINHADEYGWN